MAGQQIEATCDDIIEKITARLPDKLDEVNAQHDDAYALDPPTGVTLAPRPEMFFPHVSVEPESTDNTSDHGERTLFNHRVAVTVWLQDPDPEALIRKLIRYQRALREVVLFRRVPGQLEAGNPGGYALQHRTDEYGAPFIPEDIPDGYFVAMATSHFTVQQQQDIP